MTKRVSITRSDAAFLDDYAERHGLGSRSGAAHQAVELLRSQTLAVDYQAAWAEWAASDDAALWAAVDDSPGV